MTTEVAVMNRSAISLAADSAVTIGGDKVYNTVNKLFMLSKHHPVGVMIYGLADVNGIPWETLIKIYRKRLGERSFPTLKGYADDFLDFLISDDSPISKHQKEIFFFSCAQNICNELLKATSQALGNEAVDYTVITDRAAEIAAQIINETTSEIKNCCTAESIKFASDINDKYSDKFHSIATSTLELIYNKLKPEVVETLIDGICHYFYSDYTIGDTSGIVIAGFGDEELFPQITTYRIQGFFDETGKLFRQDNLSADEGDIKFKDQVIPFAMDDMIHTFMSGVDPLVKQFLLQRGGTAFPTVIEESCKHLQKALGKEVPDHIKQELMKIASEQYDSMFNDLDEYTRYNQIRPVTEMLRSLPKDELAEMAETLVSLIAFRKKVTKDTESVGGPIDVAVITKGDGFVWIKRKHYFDPKLNQHFLSNYNKY